MRELKPLHGFTVGVTAARRAEDLGALLSRRGADVQHAPALRTVPLADDSELLSSTKQLLDKAPDTVVATTAVGFRGWLAAADGWGLGEALLGRLGQAEILARGPKVKGAIRAAGLTERWSPESESMAEVLDRLLAEGVDGRRIAVQLHGEPLLDFGEELHAAGADVVGVPVYRWLPPEDIGPLDRLIDAAMVRDLDAVTFTSAPAVASLLNRATDRGVRAELLDALRQDVLPVCVGPVTALPLQRQDVNTVYPQRFRLGPLVQLLCDQLPGRALPVAGRQLEIRGHAVVLDGELRSVPRAGTAMLRTLARQPGTVVSEAELLRALSETGTDEGEIETAIDRLRTALGVPELIQRVAEGGYRLAFENASEDTHTG